MSILLILSLITIGMVMIPAVFGWLCHKKSINEYKNIKTENMR
jgi:hypothetical protein